MFDIVAAHQNQLTLSVQGKGVDQPQPRLARATASGNAQAMAERDPINDDDNQRDHNHQTGDHGDLQASTNYYIHDGMRYPIQTSASRAPSPVSDLCRQRR